MKKVFHSLKFRKILFSLDIIFAFVLPLFCTLAIIPPIETEGYAPAYFLFIISLFMSASFSTLANTNNFPEEGKLFVPFLNTTISLAPLSFIIFLERFEPPVYILVIPYLLSGPIFALQITQIKNLILNCLAMYNVFLEIQSNLISISEIRKKHPKSSFNSSYGKMIVFHLQEIWDLVETGQQYHQFTPIFKNNLNMDNLPFNKKTLAKKIEETADDDFIKLSGKNVRGNPYVSRKTIVDFIIKLYDGYRSGGKSGFTRVRKNCPFYEMDEMPETTAEEWLDSCKEFIIPLWMERQNQKKENLRKYNK